MRAREYLSQYIDIRCEIIRIKVVIEEIRADAEMLSGDIESERVQTSRKYDKMADYVAKMADKTEELSRKELAMYHILVDIEHTIDQIKSTTIRQVLTHRYMITKDGKQLTWEEVASAINRSARDCQRYEQKGVREVEKLLSKN